MTFYRHLIAVSLISVFMTSCNKADEGHSLANELSGTWQASAIHFSGTSIQTEGDSSPQNFVGEGYSILLKLNFNTDPAQFSPLGGYVVRLTDERDSLGNVTEWMNPGFMASGVWSVNGDQLLVEDIKGEIQHADIFSVKDSTLTLGYDFSYQVNQSEYMVTYQVHGIYEFVRKQ